MKRTLENSTWRFERLPHAAIRPSLLGRPIDQVANGLDGDARLVQLVDQLGHLHQGTRNPLGQHEKDEKRADEILILGGQGQVETPKAKEPLTAKRSIGFTPV